MNALPPMQAPSDPHPQTGGNDTIFPLIWRQKGLVLAFSLIGMVAAAFYVRFATPYWKTEARIIVARSNPLIGDGEAAAVSDNFLNTQCELIKSSPILALAISNAQADQLRLFQDVHNRISFLKTHLDVDVARHSDIIDVDMETPYPDDARRIVQAVVNAYQDFQRRQSVSADGEMLGILEREKDKRDAELDARTRELDDLRRAQSAAGFGEENSAITMQRLSTLSNALTQAQLDTLTAKSAYEQAARNAGIDITAPDWMTKNTAEISRANQSPDTLDPETIRSRLFDLQQQMAQLRKQYMSGHPAVQALQSRIDQLSLAIVGAARQRWLTAQSHEQELQTSFDSQQKLALDQNLKNGDVTRLSADIRRLQDLSDSLDRRIKELSLSSQASTFNIQMVDEAANSDDPVWPTASRLLPIGILSGMLFGIAVGLVRETAGRDASMRPSSTPGGRMMLGLPVFAAIPRQGEVSIKHVAWSAHLRPDSTIAVAFRTLRDSLQAAAATDGGLVATRTILLASPMNGEGRTIAASNLAITLAKSGKRVCLVDADLRQSALGRVYGVSEDAGLSSVLSEADTLAKAVQRTVIERLDLLPAGPAVEDPAELLNSPHFSETLDDLTLKYDHVIVDSPSLLGASDARIIAAHCDATILVLSQEGTTRRVAQQCRDGLTGVGATLVGILPNSPPKQALRKMDIRSDRPKLTRRASLPDSASAAVQQLPQRSRA